MRGRPFPINGGGRLEARCARKDLQIGRHAKRIRQVHPMQRAPQRRVVAEFGIADDRGQLKPARANLAQQRQGEPPLLLKAHGARNLSALTRVRCQPRLGQIQRGPQHPRARPRPQRRRHRDLAVGDLPQAAAVLRRATPTECGPCFGKLVPSRISTRYARGSPCGAAATRARRSTALRDEVLKRLIRAASVTRSSIALIDLRRLSLSNPSR